MANHYVSAVTTSIILGFAKGYDINHGKSPEKGSMYIVRYYLEFEAISRWITPLVAGFGNFATVL